MLKECSAFYTACVPFCVLIKEPIPFVISVEETKLVVIRVHSGTTKANKRRERERESKFAYVPLYAI